MEVGNAHILCLHDALRHDVFPVAFSCGLLCTTMSQIELGENYEIMSLL